MLRLKPQSSGICVQALQSDQTRISTLRASKDMAKGMRSTMDWIACKEKAKEVASYLEDSAMLPSLHSCLSRRVGYFPLHSMLLY